MQRIICGYYKYKSSVERDLMIIEPYSDMLYEAQDVYLTVYEECVKDGLINQEQLLGWLYEREIWDDTKEHEIINGLPTSIEDAKIDLYNNSFDEFKVINIKRYISELKTKLTQLYYQKHSYDYITANGVASFMKNYYITENCVKVFKTKEDYDWSKVSTIKLLGYRDKSTIADEEIRSIAKSSDWRGIWYSSKQNNNLFNRTTVDLTADQKRLTFWSGFYDNLSEHPECPPEKIVNDDDMIDGWVAIQRRQREKEKAVNDTEKKIGGDKIRKSGEIFIVARDEKHANDIESLNSPQSAALKQARINQLAKRGEMKDSDFNDVKTKIAMEAVNKGRAIMRGGK